MSAEEMRLRYQLAEKRAEQSGQQGSSQIEQYKARIDDLLAQHKSKEAFVMSDH